MYPQDIKNKPLGQSWTNLTLLVAILGFLALLSIGIMALSIFQQFYPSAGASIVKELNYQGKLRDSGGITVSDGDYNMSFVIWDAASGGSAVWSAWEDDDLDTVVNEIGECGGTIVPATSSPQPVDVYYGIFSVMLGRTAVQGPVGETPAQCPLDTLDFTSEYYLGLWVGADPEMTPRKRIGGSLYAFNADLLDDLDTSNAGGTFAYVPATDANGQLNIISGAVGVQAIYGEATDATAANYAGYFTAAGPNAYGVYADATNTGIGVYGHSADGTGGAFLADNGSGLGARGAIGQVGPTPPMMETARNIGVQGRVFLADTDKNIGGEFYATGSSTNNYGVTGTGYSGVSTVQNWGGYFYATGDTSYGVQALASDAGAAATNYGGHFTAAGGTGYGVYGEATYNTTATKNYGGYFTAAGAGNFTSGVYGEASATGSVFNYGGNFVAAGIPGHAVHGEATNTSVTGDNYGGWFAAQGGNNSTGVYGQANGADQVRGVRGNATSTAAVTNYGGYFEAQGESARAVYGSAGRDIASALNYGGYFSSSGGKGRGVYGQATSGGASTTYGGYFTAASTSGGTGVYGVGSATGAATNYGGRFVAAGDSSAFGVYGEATGTVGASNRGGYFIAAGDTQASGVFGWASSVTGTTYGVRGEADSATGWAGYFKGGYGVYTDNDLFVGGTSHTLSNAGFTMDGSGAGFFADQVGVEGSVYTDTSFIVGASTIYADGSITTSVGSATDLSFNTDGDDITIDSSDQLGLGLTPAYTLDVLTTGARAINAASSNATGAGVWGAATATGATTNYGGVFTAAGDTGRAISGDATASTGATNYGGYFQAQGDTGAYGIYSIASGATGTNYGVYGDVTSAAGWAGYFTGGQGLYASAGVIGAATGGYMGSGYLNAKYLCMEGVCRNTWPAGGSGSPGGADTNVQYNDGGAFGGDNNFKWTKGAQELEVTGKIGINLNPAYPLDITTSGDAYGARIINSMAGGYGVYAIASDTTASQNFGGWFEARGSADSTRGVMGYATDTSAIVSYGGYFLSMAQQGRGVYGYAADATAGNYGGYFQADGATGTGAIGIASGTGGTGITGRATSSAGAVNFGGYFEAAGTSATAVYGSAGNSGAGAANTGGYFSAMGDASGSIGVAGYALGTTNPNYGGKFASQGNSGWGVYAEQFGTTGVGVYSRAYGAGSWGVYGWASDSTVANYGGYFQADGPGGYGVWGVAQDSTAVANYGGYFTAAGSGVGTRGVYGEATSTAAVLNVGVHGVANGTGTNTSGVYGYASGAGTVYGVRGFAASSGAVSNYGGYFESWGQTGSGIYAASNNSGAFTNYGGWFRALGAGANTSGVYGWASDSSAVANYGVQGLAAGTGANTAGVRGSTSSTTAASIYGVYGTTASTGATTAGVAGINTAASGVNYGGYFTSTSATANSAAVYGSSVAHYGGYFITTGTAIDSAGVRGISNQAAAVAGVYGSTTSTSAGARGVYGLASGAGAVYGVHGAATSAGAGASWGGYFTSASTGANAGGVYGSSTGATTTTSGVRGIANGANTVSGVWGSTSSTTANARGVYGEATGAGAQVYGVYGTTGTAATGNTRGVFGYAQSTVGGVTNYGVYGLAAGPGASTTGVYGQASSAAAVANYGGDFLGNGTGAGAAGVRGTGNQAGAVVNYGGYFQANGTSTGASGVRGIANGAGIVYGVYGSTTSTTGTAAGVYGEASGLGGVYAVRGNASNTGAATNYGGYFLAAGQTGYAVYGEASSQTGPNYGGYFLTRGLGANTTAVYGETLTAASAGATFGVRGIAGSNSGNFSAGVYGSTAAAVNDAYGIWGAATTSGGAITHGGYFTSASTGIGSTGVRGINTASGGTDQTYGGYFSTAAGVGRGVFGEATYNASSTINYGGYFTAAGTGTGTSGLRAIANGAGQVYGVYGSTTSATTGARGVYGSASGAGQVYGVYGEATDSTAIVNYGGYFQANGTGGAYGVYGNAAGGPGGPNYGVYGTASSGWAGYFTGSNGLYASRVSIADTTTGIAYNTIGTAATSDSLSTTSDLFIAGKLEVDGLTYVGLSATSSTTAVCSSLATSTAPTAGVSYELRDCDGAPAADYAEFYPAAADVATGEIVVAGNTMVVTTDGDEVAQVIKSTSPYQNNIVGVISDPAKITDFNVIGYNINAVDNPKPVSLNGRVMINVSDENGPIAVGDTITSSSAAGVGMRASKTGMIVGYALDSWNGPGAGQIMVFVSPGWHANGAIASDGAVNFFNDDFSFNKTGTADAVTEGYDSRVLTLLGSGWDGGAAQNIGMRLKTEVTNATNYRLSVLNNAGVEVAYINDNGRMRVDGRVDIGGKLYPASPTGYQSTAYIFYNSNYMRTNATGWSTGSFDFAEMFLSRDALEAGDIVSVDGDTNEYVKRTAGAYDPMVLGIVSTEPGFLAGTNVDFDNPSPDQGYPIALAGRVPTKVSIENGPIVPGDPLTSSSVPGVAMKATEPGMVIGVALEGWSNPEAGKIIVFVNLSWYGTNGEMTPISELASLTMTGNLDMSGNYILNVGSIVSKDEKWAIDENGVIKVKLTEEATEKEMFGTTSPKVEMTISGTARLENGGYVVDLTLVDPDFVKNASPDTAYKILVTPNEDCNGIYVSERTQFGFTVRELRAGTSDASFDWMVVARRKGYEDPAPVVPETPPAPLAPPAEPPPAEEPPAEEPPVEPPPVEEPPAEAPPTP